GHSAMTGRGNRSLDHCLAGEGGTGLAEHPTEVLSFGDVLCRVGADQVALFKIDIEGSEFELFEGARSQEILKVDRYAIEYHEHLRPGVLSLVRKRLENTHSVRSVPSPDGRYGMLYAARRDIQQSRAFGKSSPDPSGPDNHLA